jgi:hypothetical protein
MTNYINNVRDSKLSLQFVSEAIKQISKHLVVSEFPGDVFKSGNKITHNLTNLPLYIIKGHKSWSGIAVCFPGNKEDLLTEKIGTPYIRSILYPILELNRRVKEKEEGRFECIYIVGEYISEVLLRKFRLLKFLTPNLIVLSKNILSLTAPVSIDKSVSPNKRNEDFVQKLLCCRLLEPKGLSLPARSGKINAAYIKHEMKTQRGTKEPEKLDILAYDKNDGSLIAFEIKGPTCSRVELENLFLQGIEHQNWVEESKRAIKLFYEGPYRTAINTRKRVRLFLGFFGDSVPALFYDLRKQAEAKDRDLKIEFVRFYFDMFNELFVNRFPEPDTVSFLMTPKPQQWSLRGDPYLWDEMVNHLATTKIPASIDDLTAIIEKAFIELTAHPITYRDNFYTEKYAHGGMSSGHIDPRFWKNKLIPLLVERYEKFYGK